MPPKKSTPAQQQWRSEVKAFHDIRNDDGTRRYTMGESGHLAKVYRQNPQLEYTVENFDYIVNTLPETEPKTPAQKNMLKIERAKRLVGKAICEGKLDREDVMAYAQRKGTPSGCKTRAKKKVTPKIVMGYPEGYPPPNIPSLPGLVRSPKRTTGAIMPKKVKKAK